MQNSFLSRKPKFQFRNSNFEVMQFSVHSIFVFILTYVSPCYASQCEKKSLMANVRENHPEGPIVPNKSMEEIRQEPYTMPGGFEWSNVNVLDESDRDKLYHLLANKVWQR